MRHPGISLYVAVAAFVLVATTHSYTFDDPMTHTVASDSYEFLRIARAAPGLPPVPVSYQHGQRMVVPYAIGLAAKASGLPLLTLFGAVTACALAAATIVFVRVLLVLGLAPPLVCAMTGLYLFLPYNLRYLLAFPGLVNDAVFRLGLSMVLLALVTRRSSPLIGGGVVAAIGRQTTMTFLPLLAFVSFRSRRTAGVVTAAAVVAVYVVTGRIAEPFSEPSINGSTLTGLFADLRAGVGVSVFARFAMECASAVVLPFALLLFVDLRRAAVDLRLQIALALLWAGIIASPLLGGPSIMGGNAARLTALASAPLLVHAGVLLQRAGRPAAEAPLFVVAVSAAAFLGSLHHIYSFGPGRTEFGLLTLAALLVLVIAASVPMLKRHPAPA